MQLATLPILLAIALVYGQRRGPTAERHPEFPTQKCSKAEGCIAQHTTLVLDALYRKINDTSTGQSCVNATSGGLNATICPTAEACAANCAVDGVADYEEHGVFVHGGSVTLRQWLDVGGAAMPSLPRVYLLDAGSQDYVSLRLLNQEFSFTVDASNLPCGQNGALFFSAMDPTGGRRPDLNPAGAAYGTGYCDAGCPASPWIDGVANPRGAGACCAELDVWEANARATAMALHPCRHDGGGERECAGDDGGACRTRCAANGCGYNPYARGREGFYGPHKTLDTRRPFTVLTQFVAPRGRLAQVKRFYLQNASVVPDGGAQRPLDGGGPLLPESVVTDGYCAATNASAFLGLGGMAQMGEALGRGMVPIFCIWNSHRGFMNWLDAGGNGPCNETEGDPEWIVKENPGTSVTFSDVRWGEIGSTWPGRLGGSVWYG